jgi:hypothetical protein
MNGTTLAVLIEWEDGRQLVVTLGQLSDLSPRRLAGASLRLVTWCLCCGSLLETERRARRSPISYAVVPRKRGWACWAVDAGGARTCSLHATKAEAMEWGETLVRGAAQP